MTRGLTPAALAAVTAEVVTRTLAVELDFPAGVVRYAGCPQDLTIAGQTFLGVGALGSVSAAEESGELRAYGLTVALTGIPRDLVAVALQQAYQGRRATVWEVPLAPTGLPVADPIVIFRGRMDTMEVALGDTATVRVRLENRLTDWDRPRVRRYTDEDQRAQHPDDRGLEFVSSTSEKELIWPARTFFQR
jgi:hypothetical protein